MNNAPLQTATTGNYAKVNGISMYYEIRGTGFPLVLIHGGGSTINTTFGKIIPLLAQVRQVIAVELQAHGRTGDRDAPETFAQDADDVAQLLKQLGIAQADVFGFSNGGQTTLELGIRYPALIHKLIVASAFYSRAGAPEGFWDGFEHATLNNMPSIYHEEFLKVTNNNHAGLLNMFNKDVERMLNFKGWTAVQISTIQAPTLVVLGDQDLPSAEHAVEMCTLLPNSRLAILPGTHGSYMGEAMSPNPNSKIPELFVALVDEFLA